jgi:eukaryotic-like serine/threonine-protein kinase
MVAHLEQPVPPLNVPGREVPLDLEAVIRRCLEKEPADRFPDVMSLEMALADCECAEAWTREAAARWWRERLVPDLSSEHDVESPARI